MARASQEPLPNWSEFSKISKHQLILTYATKWLHNETVESVFKALADPIRRELLDVLFQKGGMNLSELAECHPVSRQAIAKHLRVLEEANLVAVVWKGREKLHYLNPVPIHEIAARWIGKFQAAPLAALYQLKRGLEPHSDRLGSPSPEWSGDQSSSDRSQKTKPK